MKRFQMKTTKYMKMLTVKELQRLSTGRLLNVLKTARAVEQAEIRRLKSHGWCCNMCCEWLEGKEAFKKKVIEPTLHLTNYKNRIKKELATREHIA